MRKLSNKSEKLILPDMPPTGSPVTSSFTYVLGLNITVIVSNQ
jgi:hypothetical protein